MMPILSPSQQWILIIGAFIAGTAFAVLVYIILADRNNKKKPKPIILTILQRYGDMFYDERFSKMSDVEFLRFLKDNAFIMVWMVFEMENRMRRKIKKEGNGNVEKPKLPPA